MINWHALGIAPTTDIPTIKKAYRTRLADTNPEDKPEEFMTLRQAYEDAINWARNGGKDPGEEEQNGSPEAEKDLLPLEHPAYAWVKEMENLYWDFGRRIDAKSWKALLSDPLCTRIDTAGDVQHALLRFLMDNWFLPDSAIREMNAVFHFDENKESLMEKYPPEFVDAILITPLTRSVCFEYQYFPVIEGRDYDQFMRLYYQLTNFVAEGQYSEAENCLQALAATGLTHPYLHVEQAKIHLQQDQAEAAAADLAQALIDYPKCPSVNCMRGEVDLVNDDFTQAETRFREVLSLYPDYRWAKIGLAEASLGLAHYDEAEDLLAQVLYEDRYNGRAKALEEQLIARQQEILHQKQADGAATPEELLKLAINYVDNDENQKGAELLRTFSLPDNPQQEAERVHYLATAELGMNQNEAAVQHFREAQNIHRQRLEVAADEEDAAHAQAMLCRSMVMESIAWEQMGKLEEALETVTNANIDFPDRSMVLCRKAELHEMCNQHQEAIDAATQSIQLDDTFHLPLRIRAQAYFHLGHYNEAFTDCNACIDLYGGDLPAHLIKIEILIDVDEVDAALNLLDEIEADVQGTRLTFLRAKALHKKGEIHEAVQLLRQILTMDADKQREAFPPAELDTLAVVYLALFSDIRADCEAQGDYSDWDESLTLLERGVKRYPDDIDLLTELAAEYFADDRYTEAEPIYKKLTELDPTAGHFAQLAGNELRMDKFQLVEQHLQRAQEIDPDLTYAEILWGTLANHRKDYPTAIAHYEKAITLADKNEEVWYRIRRDMASLYCRTKQYDQARSIIQENIDRYQQMYDVSRLINVLCLAGQYEEAFTTGEQYLADHKDEDCGPIISELLDCNEAAGGDLARLTKYTEMLDDEYTANHMLGRWNMYNGHLKEALACFLRAAKFAPNRINNNMAIAKVQLQLRNTRKAKEYAGYVLSAVPDDYMVNGCDRAYYLVRSAEALTVLGDYTEAKKRLLLALQSRFCDTCDFSGCIDAYSALVYLACVQGDTNAMERYLDEGLQIVPDDYDLLNTPKIFTKKKGLFR